MRDAVRGAVAGLVGGLVFGACMASYGALPTVASLVRTDAAPVGFAVHLVIAALVGAGFGAVAGKVRGGELYFWGVAYGAFWWYLGPQTLLPLLTGEPVTWDLANARRLLPSLYGHLAYGAVTALAFGLLARPDLRSHLKPGPLARGLVAGLTAALVLLPATNLLLVGALAGLAYPLLFSGRREGTGPAVIRGTAYGFTWWIASALTALPLLRGDGLDWSATATATAVTELPPYLLLGAGTALVFSWLGSLSRLFLVDDVRALHDDGAGARGLHATFYGVLAGLAGGTVFAVVWAESGTLSRVAGLVGGRGIVLAVVVHLVIAQLIGVSYALLFRRRSFDLASGIGWGVSYGLLWWFLGALTLLPALLGEPLRWNPTAMAAALPSLVGHLLYGAFLGAIHQWLENRTNPWWLTRGEAETRRVESRRDQTLSAAPALWLLTVLVAAAVPVLTTPP
ncbi:hypothetical protein LO762_26010 [Actinocorallia sp. API 0066]|uniref:hypothetical protein n=1 Tax=Actinocorallia sp. API 0066 TaxID=2896846 RepID=UPI001E33E9B6|nr:hypothetical protein [Actinocorallia sp. API 0066]MCD0452611.1 hypothetical protein [Actinocorallia sp. API 0066]